MNSGDLESKLQEFRVWSMTDGGFSRQSVPKQIRTIRRFGKATDMLNVNREEIIKMILRQSEKGIKPQTLNHVIYDLEAWSRFLGSNVRFPRFKESRAADPWVPKDEEVERIRRAARNNPDRSIAMRNGILMDVLFFGGVRIGELIQINLEDVEEDGIKIRSEKGEAPRKIGLPEKLLDEIREYINYYRSRTDRNALFTTKRGRVNYQYARNICHVEGTRAGVPKFHAHAARHWCATSLLRGQDSIDIRKVQIHLGHSSLSSTQRYTHLTQQEVADEVRSKMAKFFREGKNMMISANLNESELELDGATEISPQTHESITTVLNMEGGSCHA